MPIIDNYPEILSSQEKEKTYYQKAKEADTTPLYITQLTDYASVNNFEVSQRGNGYFSIKFFKTHFPCDWLVIRIHIYNDEIHLRFNENLNKKYSAYNVAKEVAAILEKHFTIPIYISTLDAYIRRTGGYGFG